MSHSKMKSAIDTFLKGKMSRRDLLIKAGKYGIGFAALTKLMGMQVTSALAAQDFDWKKHSGTTIKLLMNNSFFVILFKYIFFILLRSFFLSLFKKLEYFLHAFDA